MPMDRKRYPANWEEISLKVRNDARWICQECGRPCRRPDEDWFDFIDKLAQTYPDWHSQYFEEFDSEDSGEFGYIEKRGRFILTTAHLNHNPAIVRPRI